MQAATSTEITDRVTVKVFASAYYEPAVSVCDHVAEAVSERGDVEFSVIDPWEQPDLVVADRVFSNPTVLFFAEGREQARLTGCKSAKRIRETLDAVCESCGQDRQTARWNDPRPKGGDGGLFQRLTAARAFHRGPGRGIAP